MVFNAGNNTTKELQPFTLSFPSMDFKASYYDKTSEDYFDRTMDIITKVLFNTKKFILY